MKHGIDISEWQEPGTIRRIKPEFAIIRAGCGRTYVDSNLFAHVEEAKALNIPFGLYWYTYAEDGAKAKEEATLFEFICRGIRPTFGCWLDIEDVNIDLDMYEEVARNFCSYLADRGHYIGIYCSESKLNYLEGLGAYDKWIANWSTAVMPSGCSIWQHTNDYNGVDGNYCRYDNVDFYNVYKEEDIPVSASFDKLKNLMEELKNEVERLS